MKRFLLCTLVLALGAVMCAGAQDDANNAQPAPSNNEVKAATPGDENQTRIKAIRRNEVFYRSYGRPDLTKALVTGEFKPMASAEIVDMNLAQLVGIVSGATDKFAMVEDGSGNGFILRVGDKVRNGRITAVTDNSVVASVSLYGMTSRVVLRLENREG
jgi:hypothetical protein